MAFDVLSMGVGEDGTSGFPLVAVYLTGKELKAAMEVDASVTPIMPAAQLLYVRSQVRLQHQADVLQPGLRCGADGRDLR